MEQLNYMDFINIIKSLEDEINHLRKIELKGLASDYEETLNKINKMMPF